MTCDLIFKNYKLTLRLVAQSPMIHFQGSQRGATLRASEVKPKFDRFIIQKLIEAEKRDRKKAFNKQDIIKIKDKYADLFRDREHDAFDYKLSIYADKAPWHRDIDPKSEKRYQIFYGNQNRHEDRFERVISDPIISIMCFNIKLQQLILKYIKEFFTVTNFGTMQSKGFGSYIISGEDYTEKYIAECLKSVYKAKSCFKMAIYNPAEYSKRTNTIEGRDDVYEIISRHIGYFYKIMKSGWNQNGEYCRSYIYQYMHTEYDMANEKAWMKHEKIAPSLNTKMRGDENVRFSRKVEKYRYVRAFLGTSGTLRYKNDGNSFVTITITPKDQINKTTVLERVPSPVFFKVICGCVYIVGAHVPDDIYNKKFLFNNSRFRKSGYISTPSKEEITFDMEDFLSKYVQFYNGKVPEKVKKINIKHINKVNA